MGDARVVLPPDGRITICHPGSLTRLLQLVSPNRPTSATAILSILRPDMAAAVQSGNGCDVALAAAEFESVGALPNTADAYARAAIA